MERQEESDYEDWTDGVLRPSSPTYYCDGCNRELHVLIPSRKCEMGCEICTMCDEETWEHDDNGNRISGSMMIYIDKLIIEKDCPGCKMKIYLKEKKTKEIKKRKFMENLKNELTDIIEKTPKLSRYIELLKTKKFTEEEINSVNLE